MRYTKDQIEELIRFSKHSEQYDNTVPEDQPEIASRIAVNILSFISIPGVRLAYRLPKLPYQDDKGKGGERGERGERDWYMEFLINRITDDE